MSLSVVKIGGSVITNKNEDGDPKILFDKLEAVLRDLESLESFVLVFGAGSFGHRKALELGLEERFSAIYGKEISEWRMQLDLYYGDLIRFCNEKLKSVKPVLVSKLSEVDSLVSLVSEVLDSGCIPLLFGCLVEGDDNEAVILSGDEIVARLAVGLYSEIVFYSDVNGVLMADGCVLKSFSGDDVESILSGMKEIDFKDATGGMRGKMESLLKFGFKNEVRFRKI